MPDEKPKKKTTKKKDAEAVAEEKPKKPAGAKAKPKKKEAVAAPEAPVTPAAEVEEPAVEETPPTPEAEAPAEVEAPPVEEAAAEAPPAEPAGKKKRKRLPRSQRRQRPKRVRERPAERKPIVRLPKPEHPRGSRQERRGIVVSSGMDKTIVVKVDTVKAHPRYKKVVRRSAKFHAHDEQNTAKVGDIVRIVETRPLSKTKNWRLAEVVEAAR